MSGFSSTSLGRYSLQKRIGRGGMARVYEGYDNNLDRSVAIKVLHDHLADDPTFRERFEQEAKFIASLRHPHIVPIFDFDIVDRGEETIYYMVMPLLPGKSLKDVLADYAERGELLPRDRVIEILQGISDALGYAHKQGMVHRDVKPANILFDEHDYPVLADFGIARLVEANQRLTQEGLSTGTPAYMSPEQASGFPGDTRSDIYSLGVIFFEMLTGKPPFGEEGSISVMLKHLNEPPPRVSEIVTTYDAAVDVVILKAMAKNPTDRYQTAEAFADAMEKALSTAATTKRVDDTTVSLPSIGAVQTNAAHEPTNAKKRGILVRSVPTTRLEIAAAVIVLTLLVIITLQQYTDISITGIFQPGTAPPTQAVESRVDGEVPEIIELVPGSMTEDEIQSMTASPYFSTDFDADDVYAAMWPQDDVDMVSRDVLEGGLYRLRNDNPGTASTSIFDDHFTFDDVTVMMEASLDTNSNPATAYGIVFNYQDTDNYNVFSLDGLGRYGIWTLEEGRWRELRNLDERWTTNENINRVGETNVLRVDIQQEQFTVYVNDVRLEAVTDTTFADGNIGMYLGSHTEGEAILLTDRYEVSPPQSSSPSSSMTEAE